MLEAFKEQYRIPIKQDVQLSKFEGVELHDTPNFEEMLNVPAIFEKSDDLISHLSTMCHERGFRLYRHSTGSHLREAKILLMCNHY